MFTGSVYFKLTPNGYVVTEAIEITVSKINVIRWKWIKEMRVQATFNFTPIKGQFCKKPHKLIQWSK